MSGPSAEQRELRFLDVEEVRLRVSVRGVGAPLLLITGLGASLDLGEPLERHLCARGFQAISFDAPGVGGSTPYRRPRRMPGFARTIEALVHTLGHDQVDVMGVSLGGAAAQQLAHQAPGVVRRLVLAATAPGVGGVPGDPRVLAHLATPRRYSDPEYFRRVAGKVYGGEARRSPELLMGEAMQRFVQQPSLLGYAGQLYAISGWSSIRWLRLLPHPTLVMAGDDDPIVPLVNARILSTLIRRARLHVVRGGGHLFMIERAAETAQLVADFLQEPETPARVWRMSTTR